MTVWPSLIPSKEEVYPNFLDDVVIRYDFGEVPECGTCPNALLCMSGSLVDAFFTGEQPEDSPFKGVTSKEPVRLNCIRDGGVDVFPITVTHNLFSKVRAELSSILNGSKKEIGQGKAR
jgi:hypothetical protein